MTPASESSASSVPLVRYRVVVGGMGLECAFSGTASPIAPEVLESRYGDSDAYMDEFTESLDAAIEEGFLLESDRSDILDEAAEKAAALLPAGS